VNAAKNFDIAIQNSIFLLKNLIFGAKPEDYSQLQIFAIIKNDNLQ